MTGTPDVITLVLVLALGHAIAALLLFFGTRQRVQIYDTIFMVSMALQAAGWQLIVFRGTLSDLLTFSIANTLIFIGFCLEGIALLSLVRPVDRRSQLFIAVVLLFSLIIWWVPFGGQDTKLGLASLVAPFFFAYPAYVLVFSAPRPSSLQSFIGSTIIVYIGATLARGIFILIAGSYNLTAPTFFQVVFLLVQIAMLVLVCAGYILIRREFAAFDLEEDISRRRKVEEEFLVQSEHLEDRVREIRCLYTVSRLIEAFDDPETFLPALAKALPRGMRHPAATSVRITYGGKEYLSENFRDGQAMQVPLQINGKPAGSIAIIRNDGVTPDDVPAFLPEETELVAAVAEPVNRMLERISAEAARRESEDKYRLLFEQVGDAIFIADTETWQIIDCNRKAEELFGYSRSEILGMTADALHPSDVRNQTLAQFRAFLWGSTTSIETEIITRYGKRVPVSINASPISFGGREYLIGIFRDVTWQKEVEKAIRERTEEVDQFFSTSLDLFCIADTDGYFRRLNPEWETTLGWPVAELEGKNFLDYVHPDDLQATLDAIRVLASQNEVIGFVNRYRHRDGSWRWIEWRSVPKGSRIYAAARDITRHYINEYYSSGLSRLKQELLIAAPLEEKLRKITDACVSLFGADFARIWLTRPGDLCDHGCIHSSVTEGLNACRDHAVCLHLEVSSGRYTHTDGGHRRVPLGAFKIGRIASGDEVRFVTNDVVHDPRVHDHAWAASLGLVAFAGFRLTSAEGKPVGVLALFSQEPVTPDVVRYLDDLATTTSQVILAVAAEEALRESKEKFQAIFNSTFQFTGLLTPDGILIEANDAAVTFAGAQHDEVINRPFWETPWWRGNEERVKRLRQAVRDAAAGKFVRYEVELQGAAGTSIVTDFSLKPVRDDQGNVHLLIPEARDITDQKMAEAALREEKQFSDAIIDRIPGIFYLLDERGNFIRANRNHQVVTGLPAEDWPVTNALATIAPEDRDRVAEKIDEVFSNGYASVTAHLLSHDGRKIPYILNEFLLEMSGRMFLVGTGIDITEQIRAEEAVRESEERYRTAIENMQDLLFRFDKDNHLVLASPSAAHAFGYASVEEMLGISAYSIWKHPEQRERYLAVMREQGGIVLDYETEFVRKDGTVFWGAFNARLRTDEQGRYAGTEGSIRDITERKQMEQALRESEEKYRAIFAAESDVFIIVDQERRKIIDCNDAVVRMYGFTREDLIGQSIMLISAEPDATRETIRTSPRKIPERLHRKKDGAVFPVEIQTDVITLKGKPVVVAAVRDITARKAAEEALRKSEEKYRVMIEDIQDMVYRAGIDGNFLMVNPSGVRLLGFETEEQMIGQPVTAVYANPDDRQVFLDELRKTGSVYGYPLILKSRDGTLLHVVASSHYFHDAAGRAAGVEGVLHNVTELRKAEDALRTANRKLNLLSGITRHDIRNQLLALKGYLELSRNVLDNREKLAGFIAQEMKVAENIDRQIGFTKDYEDLGVRSVIWQDVGVLVHDAATALPVGALTLENQCNGLEVYADPLLGKVFYNLIDNSLHYGGATMTMIRIAPRQDGEILQIVYEDDGEGISVTDKKKLFSKGFGKHTGLGLFLSREILSITGITITENGEPGRGVRFVITVPPGMFRTGGT